MERVCERKKGRKGRHKGGEAKRLKTRKCERKEGMSERRELI